jgi:uncharacterized membrane protein YagU involved in acid resistance
MKQPSLPWAILSGGAIGGALDLLFAVSFAGYNGAPPTRVFQTIASGLLGSAAFDGGGGVSVLGVVCHLSMALIWAALFAAAAWRYPALIRRPIISGAVFGIVVFLCMRLIVLPVSAFPRPVTFEPLSTTLDLLSHMFLFGTPIALFVSKAIQARRPDRSLEPGR